MARPVKYPTEQIVAALKKNKGMVYIAAQAIGCEADTIYYRAKSVPAVAKCIRHERGKVVDKAELKLFNAIEKGEPWAIQLALKTLGKSRGYVERTEVRRVEDMSDEELFAIAAGGGAGVAPAPGPPAAGREGAAAVVVPPAGSAGSRPGE